MSSAASILAVVICVLVPRAAAIKCLSCTESAKPRDCQYIQECGHHEKCSVEAFLTVSGYIRYDVGCMDVSDGIFCLIVPWIGESQTLLVGSNEHQLKQEHFFEKVQEKKKCAVAGRKRAVLNATVVTEIQQKNDFGTIPDEQWDQRDKSLCIECCDTELCNIMGCGEEGLPPNSGLICYGCDQERNPDSCNRITLCNRDYACHLSTTIVAVDLIYQSGCIHSQACLHQGVLNIGAYGIVGRRGMDMTSRFQRALFCTKCCSTNLCNADNCTLLTHLPTIVPPTTTLAPVNGNWSHWGLWSACTATCGSSVTRSRTRTCTNPAPTQGGTNCIGSAFEEVSCNLSACAIDGQWSLWMAWSACSTTCGTGGISSRQRNCNNPTPFGNGIYCIGESFEFHQCSGRNDQEFIHSVQNFTQPMDAQVVIKCVSGVTLPAEVTNVAWTAPQIIGHPFPLNLALLRDGSLFIDGLTVENIGAYSCTITTDCGTYDSPQFWVNIQ